MKKTSSWLLSIFTLVFISCNNTSNTNKETVITEVENEVPDGLNGDEFNNFFHKFKSDSSFQQIHTKFPLAILHHEYESETDTNPEVSDMFLSREDWGFVDLEHDSSHPYFQFNMTDSNHSICQQRGKDNGLYRNYLFERIEGDWYLVKVEDLSK